MDISVVEIRTAGDAERFIARTGADPYAVAAMAQKAFILPVLVRRVDNRAAGLLKQEMLSLGGDAAVSRSVGGFVRGRSDVLVLGTPKQFRALSAKLALQPFGLKKLAGELPRVLERRDAREFSLPVKDGRLVLSADAPAVMGILNATPDSFSDGGRYIAPDAAATHARAMVTAGAGLVDIGGESTRPGARGVPADEELARVVPVIRSVAGTLGVPLSVDTFKPEVARAALAAGASVVNDITGLRYGKGEMADVVRDYNVPVVLMHMRGTSPRVMQRDPVYRDVVREVGEFFEKRIAFALSRGVREEQIILDPGIGFGKTLEHNCELLRRLDEFRSLGRPLLVGTSRKSFIGRLAGGAPESGRLPGSLASVLWSAAKGAAVFRVHDVAETVQALAVFTSLGDGGRG